MFHHALTHPQLQVYVSGRISGRTIVYCALTKALLYTIIFA